MPVGGMIPLKVSSPNDLSCRPWRVAAEFVHKAHKKTRPERDAFDIQIGCSISNRSIRRIESDENRDIR